jgi:hypothetical protein
MSAAAHYVGIAGELLNFAGAFVCAVDLLQRRKEQRALRTAETLVRWQAEHKLEGLRYEGLDIDNPDFRINLAAQSATKYGVVGVSLLLVGFGLLVVYHVLEITS